MEVINDLLEYNNMKIYQNSDWFMFSLDSILLPNFVTLNKRVKKILDLGTGNAPIPLILSTRTKATIYGVEIQKELYDLAMKSVKINHLENQIKIINEDIKNLENYFDVNSFQMIVSNPPYFKLEELSKVNENEQKMIARHEIKISLEQLVQVASRLLDNKGIFAMVHRTDRLIEIINIFQKNNIIPKKIQLIYPKKGSNSNMVLIEGIKNGNQGLKILPPIIAHEENGKYTLEIKKYFTAR